MSEIQRPDISAVKGIYPDRAERMAQPEEFQGRVPHYGTEVDGELAWAMDRAATAGDSELVRSLTAYEPTLLNIQNWYAFPVYMAVRNGHADLVKEMFDAGSDPGLSNYLYTSWQTLLKIARERDFTDVLDVLKGELKTRFNYHEDFNSLRHPIKRRDHSAIENVLSTKPHLATASDEFGATAIHWAALTRQTDLIDRLLEKGADIDAERGGGDTPLHLAVGGDYWFGHEGLMGDAIENGWAVAGHLLARGATYSLTMACKLGDRERALAILTEGSAAANRLDSTRRSPLSAASGQRYTRIVQDLLEHGADPNQMEDLTTQGAALFEASAGNHMETAKLLLENGANANAGVDSSGTASTIVEHRHPETCRPMQDLLRSYGARDQPWALSHEQRSDLLASDPEQASDSEMVKHIMRSGDVDLINRLLDMNPGAFSRLSVEAVDSLPDSVEATKRILDAGIDVNRRNSTGETMLWHNAQKGNTKIVQLLLDGGADIDILDAMEGQTPLAAAPQNGHSGVVGLLLSRGADTTLADGPWAIPVNRAKKARHQDIVSLLTNTGEAI